MLVSLALNAFRHVYVDYGHYYFLIIVALFRAALWRLEEEEEPESWRVRTPIIELERGRKYNRTYPSYFRSNNVRFCSRARQIPKRSVPETLSVIRYLRNLVVFSAILFSVLFSFNFFPGSASSACIIRFRIYI